MESGNKDWERVEWMIQERGVEWVLENYKTTTLIKTNLDEDEEFLKLKNYFLQHRDLITYYVGKMVNKNT
jgi:hypothetical protein